MGYRTGASLTDIFPQSIDLLGLGRLDMHKRAGGQTLRAIEALPAAVRA